MTKKNSTSSKKSFLSSINALSLNQKIGLGIITLLVLLLPLTLYGIKQQQELLSRAQQSGSTPTSETPAITFSSDYDGEFIKVHAYLSTYGLPVDGAQMVVNFDNDSSVFSVESSALEGYNEDTFSVIANSIESEGSTSQIVYGIFSANPQQPITAQENDPLYLGYFKLLPVNPYSSETLTLMIDESKTKVIRTQTGENIAQVTPNMSVDLFANTPTPTPATSATPVPSSTPGVSPSPSVVPSASPVPSPTPAFPTQAELVYQLANYNNRASFYNDALYSWSVMWNADTNQEIQLASVVSEGPKNGLISYTADYAITETTNAILYYQPAKHLSVAVPFVLEPGQTTTVDISDVEILAGDLNVDYVIDVEDYFWIVRDFGPDATPEQRWADINYDGLVDLIDYAILAENFDPIYESPNLPN